MEYLEVLDSIIISAKQGKEAVRDKDWGHLEENLENIEIDARGLLAEIEVLE